MQPDKTDQEKFDEQVNTTGKLVLQILAAVGILAALLMSTMVENESNALVSVFVVFAFGFIVLTLPVGILLGMLAKKLAVKR